MSKAMEVLRKNFNIASLEKLLISFYGQIQQILTNEKEMAEAIKAKRSKLRAFLLLNFKQ